MALWILQLKSFGSDANRLSVYTTTGSDFHRVICISFKMEILPHHPWPRARRWCTSCSDRDSDYSTWCRVKPSTWPALGSHRVSGTLWLRTNLCKVNSIKIHFKINGSSKCNQIYSSSRVKCAECDGQHFIAKKTAAQLEINEITAHNFRQMALMIPHDVERAIRAEPLVNSGHFPFEDLRVRVPGHVTVHLRIDHGQISPHLLVQGHQFDAFDGYALLELFAHLNQHGHDLVHVTQVDIVVLAVHVAQQVVFFRPDFADVVVNSNSPVWKMPNFQFQSMISKNHNSRSNLPIVLCLVSNESSTSWLLTAKNVQLRYL